jgi:EAL domain-containing protein (putative c-di-GMP-specific phosphodiesterase class I)
MEPQELQVLRPPRRVFVIDDEDAFRLFMSRLISGLGYEVRTTCQIKSINLGELTKSDIIFVDMMMPGTDGIQVLDVLSRHQIKSSIVLMSGAHGEVLATAETIARRSDLRVIGVLNKPFRVSDVRSILEAELHEPQWPGSKPLTSEINIEDILAGLERQEFDTYFQPIVDLATNQPVSYEALARWNSKFGLVAPERFIAVAARHGVLPRLTRQIAHRALACAAKLKQRGLAWKVWVNLGTEDLVDDRLPEKLARIVAYHELPAGSLTVELTESSATINEIAMLGVLARLRLKGIDLAIDDFGTSYSSLERLSIIPFTSLKIHKQFIADMMTNTNARLIVESSIALAKRLKMKAVAEGIETEAQLHVLKQMGCEFGQGFLIAGPMKFENLVAWVLDSSRHTFPRLQNPEPAITVPDGVRAS